MWQHEEQKEISDFEFTTSCVVCSKCGQVNRKYIESHYTGGNRCCIKAKYCSICGTSFEE